MKTVLSIILSLIISSQLANAQCWKMVHTGANHCIGIKTNGTLWTWGNNSDGQLGDGSTFDYWKPKQVGFANDWSTVATGRSSTHNLAIKNDGTLWAWGYNFYGQIGDGTDSNRLVPKQIGTATDWKEVACGMFYSLALKTDGSLWAWGRNEYHECGDPDINNKFILTPKLISNDVWKQITAGDAHTLALKMNGELYACGFNFFGNVGNGNNNPQGSLTQVGIGYIWKSISAGDGHSLAVRGDNTLWSWGANNYGELGNGVASTVNVPTQIGTGSDWWKVGSGEYFSFGIKTDSSLWAWGRNGYGQLGLGNNSNQSAPVLVDVSKKWTSIQGGREHTIGLTKDGFSSTTGRNTYGTLGNNTDVHSNVMLDLLCFPVGIHEVEKKAIQVFPNPAYDMIHFSLPVDEKINKVTVYNALGQYQFTFNEPIFSIDISQLKNGLYTLVINHNKGNYIQKFVKE